MSTPDSPRPRPRRFSMIRSFVLADFLTLGNGFCGAGTILALMQYLISRQHAWLTFAFGLLPVANSWKIRRMILASSGTISRSPRIGSPWASSFFITL